MLDTPDSDAATIPTRPADPLLRAGARVGRFTILGLLGAGGMGAVYEARDPQLDRSVALKLLPGRGSDVLRLRLVREAQALAQLQHPNVVAVHEVGIADDVVFIAMELIDGTTLGGYLAARRGDWRDVVDAYVQAGRGLVAAHGKGLIHRDFKPGNVLVSVDGRVRVTDFGLARLGVTGDDAAAGVTDGGAASDLGAATTHDASDSERAPVGMSPIPAEQALLGAPLTDAGALLGTRRYMAPEQFAAKRASEASDQFSFCVALWESLFGQHPFPGGMHLGGLAASVPGARVIAVPRGRAPRRLVQLLTRGLAASPAERHPSMAVLVDALVALPLRRRRVALLGGAVALTASAALLAAVATGGDGVDCARAGRDLDAIWTAPARAALVARFGATRPDGGETAGRVTTALDTWSRRWHDTRVDACRATHDRGEQSADLLDRRVACLDRGRVALASLLAALGNADGGVVDRALDAVAALPAPQECSPANVAGDRTASRDLRAVFIERTMQEAETQSRLGRTGQAIGYAAAAVARAAAFGDASLQTRAHAQHGNLTIEKSPLAARQELESSLATAAAAGDRRTEAQIEISLLRSAMLQGDMVRAESILPAARAALAASSSATQRRRLLMFEAGIQAHSDAIDAALSLCDQIKDDASQEALFKSAQCRCDTLYQALKVTEGIEACESVIRIAGQYYGVDHPVATEAMGILAQLYKQQGKFDAVMDLVGRVVDIQRRHFGEQSEAYAKALVSAGHDRVALGRDAEALRDLEAALAILTRPGHLPSAALLSAHLYLGSALSHLGRKAEAGQHATDGLALAERLIGTKKREMSKVLMSYGTIMNAIDHRDDALAAFRRGELLATESYGPDSAATVGFPVMQARILLDTGKARDALVIAQRLFPVVEKVAPPNDVALTEAILGEALIKTGARQDGRGHLLSARARFIATGEQGRRDLQEVERLLSAHGGVPATPAP